MARYIIAKDGESPFHIAVHQYSDEAVRHAAAELQKYILKSTGAVIPYFADCCKKRSPEIMLGANVRGETRVENEHGEEGFFIRAAGENITITGGSSRAILYGVYRFLEIFCNFSCFTKDVETIDKFETLEIELTEIKEKPAFEFRDDYFRNAFDGDFCVKNRLNSNLADVSDARGGKMKWFNFHHSFADLVPEEVYFKTHSEYFSEIDGVRQEKSQLCLTNNDVLNISKKQLRKWISENPRCRVFSISQNDNSKRCTCKDCMAIEKSEGSPAGPIIRFVNELARDIRDDYPDVLLHTFAYQYSLPAPKSVVADERVIVRLCSLSCRFDKPFEKIAKEEPEDKTAIFVNALNDWKDHAHRLYVWDYAVNFINYLQPMLYFHTLAENIRYFSRIGVLGILEQGNFAYGGGASCDDLKSYIIAKLLWNPECDFKYEIHRFCSAVYGERAGALFEKYIEVMEKACSSAPIHIYEYTDTDFINDSLISECDSIFKEALKIAETPEQKMRLEREHLAIRYLKLTRSPLNSPGRNEAIDEFICDVKSHGITEIMERNSLAVSKEIMLTSRYTKERNNTYRLYYIMQ